MSFNLKHLTALSLSLGLIGCAQFPPLADDATPTQRMVYATERHLTQEKSYNFQYNFKVDELSYTPEATTTTAKPDADAAVEELQRAYDLIKATTLGLNIDANGAVDFKRGKFEVIPAVRYQTPNLYAKIKLPILLDLGRNSLYVDPAAITNLPLDIDSLAQYRQPAGTFYRITLAEKQATADLKKILTEIPLSDLKKLYIDSYAKSLAKLPAQSIQIVAVDDWGLSLGAQQQIQLTLSLSEFLNHSLDLQLNLLEAAMAYLQDYKGNALPEHLVAAVKNLDTEAQQLPREFINELLEKLSKETGTEVVDILTDTKQLAGVKSLYLDQNHRLLGQQDGLRANVKGVKLNVNSRISYSHFGRPQWQIDPNKVTVIDSKVTILTDDAWATLSQPPTKGDDDIDLFDDEEALVHALEEAIAAAAATEAAE